MDANKVVLMGRGLKEATVREEAEFIIDGSQAGPGMLMIMMNVKSLQIFFCFPIFVMFKF